VFDTDTALMRFNALEETLCESERLFLKELARFSAFIKLFNLASIRYEDILTQYVEEGLHEGKRAALIYEIMISIYALKNIW